VVKENEMSRGQEVEDERQNRPKWRMQQK